jgi:hypothetical protein
MSETLTLPWGWEAFEWDGDVNEIFVVDTTGKSFDGIYTYDLSVTFDANTKHPRALIEYGEGEEEEVNVHKVVEPWDGKLKSMDKHMTKANTLAKKWEKEGEVRMPYRPISYQWAPPEDGEGSSVTNTDIYGEDD